jgi:hypothetical protein
MYQRAGAKQHDDAFGLHALAAPGLLLLYTKAACATWPAPLRVVAATGTVKPIL